MAKIERPRGTRDLGPDEMARRRAQEAVMRRVAESFGYREVQTPTFEHLELFTAKSGAGIVGELYDFKDKSGRELTLRPELTAPVMRFFVNEMAVSPKPIRLYYTGSCFRYERPQAGRFREFTQFGVELIGAEGPLADAEVVALAAEILRACKVPQFSVRVGHVGLLRMLVKLLPCDEATRAKTYPLIDKDDPGLLDHLSGTGAPEPLAHAIETVAQFQASLALAGEAKSLRAQVQEQLRPVRDAVSRAGLPKELLGEAEKFLTHVASTIAALGSFGLDAVALDLGVARGLDYYTGLVFEIDAEGLGAQKQVCGGGAYTLAELFGGQPTATAGFAIGFDRVLLVSGVPQPAPAARVHVAAIGEDARIAAARIARDLREAGVACTFDVVGRSPSKNLEFANATGIARVVLLGPKEIERGVATVKDMKSGTQREVALQDLAAALR